MLGKTMPHDVATEQAVIAAALLEAEVLVPHFVQRGLVEAVFFVSAHALCWQAIFALYEKGLDVDEVSVGEYLEQIGEAQKVGGITGINEIVDRIETTSHSDTHLTLLLRLYRHRLFLKKAQAMLELLWNKGDFDEISAEVAEITSEISALTIVEDEVTQEQIIEGLIQRTEDEFSGLVPDYGPNTIFFPWDVVNREFGALDPDDGDNFLQLISAYTAEGKSSAGRHMVMHNLERGKRVVCFQLEGTQMELYKGMAAQASGCATKREDLLKEPPQVTVAYRQKLDFIHECIKKNRLFSFKKEEQIEEIAARCKQVRSQFGRIDMVMVDYLQLVESSKWMKSREELVSYIAKQLYRLGKSLGCPVVGLVQFNRQYNRDAPADIKWLRESAGLEQNATGILMITWPTKDANGTVINERAKRPVRFWQVKRRSGERRACWMDFIFKNQKFIDAQIYHKGESKAARQQRTAEQSGEMTQITQITGDTVEKFEV